MILYYSPEIETTGLLPETESAHCARVMRMKQGDAVTVTDGRGSFFDCIVTDAHPKHTAVEITGIRHEPRWWKPRITLAVAPTKNNDRMEWLAEKAVEIGVDSLVFLDCRNSVRHVVKEDRIRKIMVSAMKQSLKADLPELESVVPLREFLSRPRCGSLFMGYCAEGIDRRQFAGTYDGLSDITLLIGPEGDFSPEEVEEAMASGFIPVTFGNTRLRTETAALYGLVAAHTLITLRTSNS